MKFMGHASSRSSKMTNSSLPGESEIMKCNPDREKKLLELGNWKQLEEGTLNLEVDPETVEFLRGVSESWYESPESIIPPRPDYRIHFKRGGYKYFKCTVNNQDESCNAILRIGALVPLKKRVELYSDVNLRAHFNIKDGDWLCVTLNED